VTQCTKFHTSRWTCWFFTSFYLQCIWPDAVSRCIRHRNSIKLCASIGKSATETLAMIRQAFGEEGMSRTRNVQTHRDREKRDRWRAKSRACSSFFYFKGIVCKEFVLAGQTANSAYYCDVLRWLGEYVRRLRPELWGQNYWLLYHDKAPSHTSSFIREFFTKSNMTVVLP
jgi:hypothetical protein